nr:hypothetical protein [Nocardioides rubriscoriae]
MDKSSPLNLEAGARISGWRLNRSVPGARHVWFVSKQGTQGVLKTSRDARRSWSYQSKRFRDEVRGMRLLSGDPGILRLLDSDGNTSPQWMVTPRAVLLADHFSDPDLVEVVRAIHSLALTLVRVREAHGIAHRDLKPPNLFWSDGRAVIGDFGIATWPEREAETRLGGGLGPAHFMAPEVREWTDETDPFPADVFSLAKCLWALAAHSTYPPDGPLSTSRDVTSLVPVSGDVALSLARLLEIATSDDIRERPSMSEFARELALWLGQQAGHELRSSRKSAKAPGGMSIAEWTYYNRARKGPEAIASDSIALIHRPLRDLGPPGDSGDSNSELTGLLDNYDDMWPEDWEFDFSSTRCLIWDGHPKRVMVAALGYGDDEVTYVAEWQVQDDQGIWHFAWRGVARARLGLPSDREAGSDLAERIRLAEPGPLLGSLA